MTKNKRNKRNFLIYPSFQIKLIFFFILINFINLIIFFMANRYFFMVFEGKGQALGIPSSHIFFRFIESLKTDMNIIFIFSASLTLVLVLIGGLIISHKAAGPIYRLLLELKGMKESKSLNKISFRSGDYLKEVEVNFNEVVDTLNNK